MKSCFLFLSIPSKTASSISSSVKWPGKFRKSVRLQSKIKEFVQSRPEFSWAVSETQGNFCPCQQNCLIIYSATWQLSESLTWVAEREEKKGRRRTQNGSLSVYRTASCSGAGGCGNLSVWPLLSGLWVNSSIFIDPLWLMSPATGRIKLQRSHTSQGYKEGEKWAKQKKQAGMMRKCRFSVKARAKRSKHQKGKASRLRGAGDVEEFITTS